MRSTQTTRRQFVLLAAVAALLLLSTVASAQPGGYTVKGETLTGGGYRLTGASPPADGTMIGGGYQLLGVAKSPAAGSGCCCTYLPCILRNR